MADMNRDMLESEGDFCSVHLDGHRPDNKCMKTGSRFVDVKVPVSLKSKPSIGRVEVECCGEPTVQCVDEECCEASEVLITQKICVKLPIMYEVTASMGESCITCEDCHGNC